MKTEISLKYIMTLIHSLKSMAVIDFVLCNSIKGMNAQNINSVNFSYNQLNKVKFGSNFKLVMIARNMICIEKIIMNQNIYFNL